MAIPWPSSNTGEIRVITPAPSLPLIATARSMRWLRIGARSRNWPGNAKELWFGGAPAGAATAIYSIAGGGPPRVVMTIPGVALLQDIDRQGRLLFVRDATRGG